MKRAMLFVLVALVLSACAEPSTPVPTPLPTATSEPTATPSPTETPLPTSTPEPTATPTPQGTPTPIPPFGVSSSAFEDGGTIPARYTFAWGEQCQGENYSLPLSWVGAPAETQSFAVIMDDPDAGGWVHWVQFNIPGEQQDLPEAVGGPEIGVKGINDFRKMGYSGPCPPHGTHRYVLTLYALDSRLPLSEGATRAEVEAAMEGHILEQIQLVGLVGR